MPRGISGSHTTGSWYWHPVGTGKNAVKNNNIADVTKPALVKATLGQGLTVYCIWHYVQPCCQAQSGHSETGHMDARVH